MKTYFDSSALIAAMVEGEEYHASALDALAGVSEGITSTHALAEIFATVTSGRLDIRLTPNQATELIETSVAARLEVMNLTLSDYRQAMKASHKVGARGGALYDMLHIEAARRCRANRILTINVRHFQTFAPDLKHFIVLPGAT
jgi:predicted nucleic acid-binding protein